MSRATATAEGGKGGHQDRGFRAGWLNQGAMDLSKFTYKDGAGAVNLPARQAGVDAEELCSLFGCKFQRRFRGE